MLCVGVYVRRAVPMAPAVSGVRLTEPCRQRLFRLGAAYRRLLRSGSRKAAKELQRSFAGQPYGCLRPVADSNRSLHKKAYRGLLRIAAVHSCKLMQG